MALPILKKSFHPFFVPAMSLLLFSPGKHWCFLSLFLLWFHVWGPRHHHEHLLKNTLQCIRARHITWMTEEAQRDKGHEVWFLHWPKQEYSGLTHHNPMGLRVYIFDKASAYFANELFRDTLYFLNDSDLSWNPGPAHSTFSWLTLDRDRVTEFTFLWAIVLENKQNKCEEKWHV